MNRITHFFIGTLFTCSLQVGLAAESPSTTPAVPPTNADGNSPLHLAVLRGDADAVDELLKHGADAAAVNAAGATPLHYATASERMVTALLAHGAPVNATTKLGNTPLVAAVVHPNSFAVARRLIDAGADIKYVLCPAIDGGDQGTVILLLNHGAEVNPAEGGIPISSAAFDGHLEIVKLLLAHGAKVNCRNVDVDFQPLGAALWTNHDDIARLLIEHGAKPNVPFNDPNVGVNNMVLSAYDDTRDPAIARLLVEHGVDVNSAADNGDTALSYALKRGSDSPLVAYLREAGAKDSSLPRRTKTIPSRDVPADPAARQAMMRAGVQRAIDLIQLSSTTFLQVPTVRDQQKCTSCHQQELPNVAMALARERGLRVDQRELGRALHALVSELNDHVEEIRQMGPNLPLNPLVLGFVHEDLHAFGFALDAVTETTARALLEFQHSDGSWSAPVRRPPMEDGPLVATAWAARALQLYPPAGHEREVAQALERTRAWLAGQKLRDFNDRVFQLLGIAWTNETVKHMRPLTERLIAMQSPDGGWAQFPTLESDAWATGSALVALHKAGVPTSHSAYQRAVTFLLRTQFDDGSWWVRSRTIPVQPHFNGKFPHGKDQWISAAGTAWAMIALLNTLEPIVDPGKLTTGRELIAAFKASPQNTKVKGAVAVAAPAANAPTATAGGAATIDFTRDIHPILERSCVGCHSGEKPKGEFNLTSRELLLKGGQSGESAIVPGYAEDSQMIQYASGNVEDFEMPPLSRRKKYPALSAEELERLHTWIDAGAPWPATAPAFKTSAPTPTASKGTTAVAASPGA